MSWLPGLNVPLPILGHGSGALFDPRVVVVAAGGQDDEHQPRRHAAASATTINAQQVHISTRLVPAPGTSLVHVQTDDKLREPPCVMAAHGDLLLVYMAVVVGDDHHQEDHLPPGQYPAFPSSHGTLQHNLFVYRVHPERPWLRRLPLPQPQVGFLQSPAGIVVSGGDDEDGDFMVADLNITPYDITPYTKDVDDLSTGRAAQLLRYSSATDRWDLKLLTMPYDGDALKPFVWRSDKVFSCSSSGPGPMCMYWVDYQVGLLRCNVGDDSPKLHFIRLPDIKLCDNSIPIDIIYAKYGRPYSEAYRTAGACCSRDGGAEVVKLVHVDNGLFGTVKRRDFTVTTWALVKKKGSTTDEQDSLEYWEKASVLRVEDELWPLPTFKGSPLPRSVPQFPMVTMQGEDLLHFILHQRGNDYDDWIITVDMRQKMLLSYENRSETVRYPLDEEFYRYQQNEVIPSIDLRAL